MLHALSPLRQTVTHRTVIALHCSGAGGRVFDSYRALLGPDTELTAPDLLGSGAEAEWPLGEPLTIDTEAERLAPLLARAPDGVHLIGHSYGGALALQMALRWPQHVQSLTLYEPVRFRLLGTQSPAWQEIVGVGGRIAALTAARRFGAAARLFVDYWSGPGTWSSLPTTRQATVAGRMPKVRAEFEALFSDIVSPVAYAALKMPIAVLAGGHSPYPARKVAEELVQICRQARLVHLPGRGHMGALEDPAAVLAWLPKARTPLAAAA